MNGTLNDCATVLVEAGFQARAVEILGSENAKLIDTLAFEDATVLGFVVVYSTPAELIAGWQSDRDRIAMRHRSALQTARQKAWNAYLVLISEQPAEMGESLVLGQIEENLEGIRKITKAGVKGTTGARAALLPLLPFRAAPSLDPIDMREEIASRSSELDEDIVQAFLSTADEGVVMQLLEDRQ